VIAGGFAMRPRERRETSKQDLFRSRLDQIIDMKHALVKLARATDWGFSGGEVGGGIRRQAGPAAIADAADGRPAILKHTYRTVLTNSVAK
jgi:transposase, IS5 family